MRDYLASNANYNYDQTLSNELIAKSLAATTDWLASNTPGNVGNDLPSNNKSGFKALPGGYRYSSDGLFSNPAYAYGYWWSASVNTNNPSKANTIRLYYNFDSMDFDALQEKEFGCSVRCIKD